MSSLDKECNELKNAYDACFNTWFTEKFLQGNSKEPCPCEAMLKAYSECVKVSLFMKKAHIHTHLNVCKNIMHASSFHYDL